MADRTPFVSWPGVDQPISVSYTLSHGISAGCASLTLLPQDANKIAVQGDLVIGDGVGLVRLKNCKVAALRTNLDTNGFEWSLDILDRRWRWTTTGVIAGTYNVIDATRDVTRPPADKGPWLMPAQVYVPWTRMLPHDLIRLCLDAMGEKNYVIDAPNVAYPLPSIDWDHTNPAQALSALVEAIGCRIVYRPAEDAVWVVPQGKGRDLPDGSISRESPGITSPQRPDSIMLVGAPVKYQTEWLLEAVGEEWDGSLVPIDDLSYAPPLVPARHKIKVVPAGPAASDVFTCTVLLDFVDFDATFTASTTTLQDTVNGLAAALTNALPPAFSTTAESGYLTIEGPADGDTFSAVTSVVGTGTLEWELLVKGMVPKGRWSGEFPPFFGNVQAVPGRLTYAEALRLAQKSVGRWYRIVNLDPVTGVGTHFIPHYGDLDIIQRVVLLDEQIEEIVPTVEADLVFGRDGLPVARNFYNGLWQVKPARCYGVYYQAASGLLRKPLAQDFNSNPEDEVLVDLSINAARHLVQFAEPVVQMLPDGQFMPANIRLRCACHLRDQKTNQVRRYLFTHDLPGPKLGTAPAVIRHDDVEFLVKEVFTAAADKSSIGRDVTGGGRPQASVVLDNRGEALARSRYYVLAAALRYQQPVAGDRVYNGIVPVFVDGKITQAAWHVVMGVGANTIASVNSEFSVYFPQYPERLRWEYLKARMDETSPGVRAENAAKGVVLGYTK